MNYAVSISFVLILILSTPYKVFGDAAGIPIKDESRLSKLNSKDGILTKDGPPPPTCRENRPFVWCLPPDYNKNTQPWIYINLTNSTLPWYYDFSFKVFDVQEIHEFDRTLKIDMYFGIFWKEPRLNINLTAVDETKEANIGGSIIGIPMNYFEYFWFPDLEIFGLSHFESSNIVKPMAGLKISRDKVLRYNVRVRTILSCEMNFDLYPFDTHKCVFRASSFYHHQDIVNCTSNFEYSSTHQRSLGFKIQMRNLSADLRSFTYHGNDWSTCGFSIFLKRTLTQLMFQVYFTSTLLVTVTWISFMLNPNSVQGRIGLLVTVFLALINIFIGVKNSSPASNGLNAVDLFLVVCIGYVFAAIFEYACVLSLYCRAADNPEPKSLFRKRTTVESSNEISSTVDGNAKEVQTLQSKISSNPVDLISLILFPTTFAILFTIYFKFYVK